MSSQPNAPMVPRDQVEAILRYRLDDPFEDALLEYAEYAGLPLATVRQEYERLVNTPLEEITGKDIQVLPVHIASIQMNHILTRLQIMLGVALTYPTDSFLDIGAGTGRDCLAFARCGKLVTHADLPWPGVDFARWRYAQRGLDIRIADVRALPPERFSAISCFDVFEHVADPVELMVNFAAHLAPEGWLFTAADLFNPIPTHDPKNDFYATFYDALLRHLGLEMMLGNVNAVQDACVAGTRIYRRTRPIRAAFAEEYALIKADAYAFAEKELGRLYGMLATEYHRVQSLANVSSQNECLIAAKRGEAISTLPF